MCPADTNWANSPEDDGSHGGDGSAAAPASGSIVDSDVSGPISAEDRAPNYPPATVTISIGMDEEPYVINDGGLPDWILMAGMARILDTIRQAEQSDTWDLSSNCDTEEDE